ncbi:hypothetical protein D6D01_05151 [Aureobasidium pullulans]|uniref:Uncharacterized protein n=1 Tax=Aureobasidium pullulans TaxID=5580 RepID=A0A4S9L7N1_AURPU|nr:hypothetical protein D6D01_05151 [Aureobasidium pullulans]
MDATRQVTDPGEYTSLRSALFECKAVFKKFIAEGPELDAVKVTAIQQLQRAQNMMAKVEQADADHVELDELRKLKRKFESTQNNQETLINTLRTERQNDSAELTQLRQAKVLYNDREFEIGRFRAEADQVQRDSAELTRLRLHKTNA